MENIQLGVIESRFADIIWQNEPLSSSDLARRAEALLGWKKTTSFTVLKRLCNKGLFENNKGTVTSIIKRDEFYSGQSRQFVNDTFGGSLPAFIAAFTGGKKLTEDELAALVKLIEEN